MSSRDSDIQLKIKSQLDNITERTKKLEQVTKSSQTKPEKQNTDLKSQIRISELLPKWKEIWNSFGLTPASNGASISIYLLAK